MENQNLFSIQYASNISGVGLHTIRAWERRYGAVNPARTDNGRRSYTKEQIEKLKLLKLLTNKGTSISQVASLSLDQLKDILDFSQETQTTTIKSTEIVNYDQLLDRLKAAVSFKKLDVLDYELDKIASDIEYRDLCMKLVVPFLSHINELYQKSALTGVEENALTAVFRYHLSSFLFRPVKSYNSSKTIALATLEGEQHDFGILVGSLLAKNYSIKPYYLGVNLKKESLIKAARELEVDLVILGCGRPYLKQELLSEYIHLHFEELSATELWVGGAKDSVHSPSFPLLDYVESFEKLDHKLSRF